MRDNRDLDDAGDQAHRAVSDLTTAERAMVYRWLAAQFAAPLDKAGLLTYRTQDGMELLHDLTAIDEVAPVAVEIVLWLHGTDEADLEVIALDLSGEFSRLFLGVGGRRSAPPCRSFYANSNGRMMQAPAAAMRRLLRDLDVGVAAGFSEPPDHIAVQLSAMAALVLTRSRAEQAAYLEEHLLDWLPQFRDRCRALTAHGYYSQVASATLAFAETDARGLRD